MCQHAAQAAPAPAAAAGQSQGGHQGSGGRPWPAQQTPEREKKKVGGRELVDTGCCCLANNQTTNKQLTTRQTITSTHALGRPAEDFFQSEAERELGGTRALGWQHRMGLMLLVLLVLPLWLLLLVLLMAAVVATTVRRLWRGCCVLRTTLTRRWASGNARCCCAGSCCLCHKLHEHATQQRALLLQGLQDALHAAPATVRRMCAVCEHVGQQAGGAGWRIWLTPLWLHLPQQSC